MFESLISLRGSHQPTAASLDNQVSSPMTSTTFHSAFITTHKLVIGYVIATGTIDVLHHLRGLLRGRVRGHGRSSLSGVLPKYEVNLNVKRRTQEGFDGDDSGVAARGKVLNIICEPQRS